MTNGPLYNDPFVPAGPAHSLGSRLRRFFTSKDVLNILIVINISVYLALWAFGLVLRLFGFLTRTALIAAPGFLQHLLSCPASFAELARRPWGMVTSLFVHAGFGHIFFNMLMLYVVGKMFLAFLSEKQLAATYLAGGIFGNLFYMAAYNIFPAFAGVLTESSAVGASGSIMAIMAAITFYRPGYSMNLLFIGRVKLLWITLAFVAIDLISIPEGNAGGHIAHIGGVVYGLLYILVYGGLMRHGFTWQKPRRHSEKGGRRKKEKYYVSKESGRPMSDEEYNARKAAEQARIDSILDKISQYGYGALSADEKDFLFHYSKKP